MVEKTKPSAIVVFCTASSVAEGHTLAEALVGGKYAACVNIVPQVQSTYWWKGKIERTEEALLIIKTRPQKFDTLVQRIKKLHSYSVPEILAVPVLKGNPDYLKWLKTST